MTDWLSADWHIDHPLFVEKKYRPFTTVDDMNAAIMAMLMVIKPGDRLFLLGDVAFGKRPEFWIEQIPGQLFLIQGNHDGKRILRHPRWSFVGHYYELKDHGDLFVLAHYAHEVWNKSHWGSFHCHGHSHGSLARRGRRMDVSPDAIGFRLISLDEVRTTLLQYPVHQVDHHVPTQRNEC